MNTPSHLLMTVALGRQRRPLPGLQRFPLVKGAFWWGAVAPDLALWLLSFGGIGYYHGWLGWSLQATFRHMFDQLYFFDPVWICLHQTLHAPLILLLGLGLVWRYQQPLGDRAPWLWWFLWACLLHTGVDILTHADDGPLLLFPLEWTLRFPSPVSYWDPQYYGREFRVFELCLNGLISLYLLTPWVKRRWGR